MRRAIRRLIAASSVVLVVALSGCEALTRPPASNDRAEAYTTVDAQRLYLSNSLVGLLWRPEELNQAGMVQHYELGLDMGEKGIPWQRLPPGYQL